MKYTIEITVKEAKKIIEEHIKRHVIPADAQENPNAWHLVNGFTPEFADMADDSQTVYRILYDVPLPEKKT